MQIQIGDTSDKDKSFVSNNCAHLSCLKVRQTINSWRKGEREGRGGGRGQWALPRPDPKVGGPFFASSFLAIDTETNEWIFTARDRQRSRCRKTQDCNSQVLLISIGAFIFGNVMTSFLILFTQVETRKKIFFLLFDPVQKRVCKCNPRA